MAGEIKHSDLVEQRMLPTMLLRWARTGRSGRGKPVLHEWGLAYFILQQRWQTADGGAGEWRDIPVENTPLAAESEETQV